MTAPHVHACRECDPSLRPSETRESEQHFGVQFGHRHHDVFLDDQLLDGGVECVAGADGWVLRYALDESGKRHLCPCRHVRDRNVCAERVRGTVSIEEKVSA